jgi:hypothetical protein
MAVPKGTRIGGRTKGTKNKATVIRETFHAELVEQAKVNGQQPLEYMLDVMRNPEADEKRRDAMAVAAASFVHPRLAAITADVKADVDATHHLKIQAADEIARRLGRIVERSAEDESTH